VEVWQTSSLRRLRLGEEKKKEEEERRTNHSMKIYMVSLFHRATINSNIASICLSSEDIAEIERLRDVAMATNFGTALAANGL